MTRDDIIARLRKISALAAHGVGGEADNASILLDRIAAATGIDLVELDVERKSMHTYRTGRELWRRDLFCQILWKIDGGIDCWNAYVPPVGTMKNRNRRRGKAARNAGPAAFNAIRAECTDIQFVESIAKFEILQRDYARQQKAFFRAFLVSNDLLLDRAPDDPPSTPEAEAFARDARRLATGIFTSQLHRQIEG